MTIRRNTIQKDLVRNAVYEMKRHVTANEVYEFIKESYPTIGKGTVYRNLDILVEEGALRKVEVSEGPNRFDFTLKNHYHVRLSLIHILIKHTFICPHISGLLNGYNLLYHLCSINVNKKKIFIEKT